MSFKNKAHRQLRHGEPQREREEEERDIDGVGPHLEGERISRVTPGNLGEKKEKREWSLKKGFVEVSSLDLDNLLFSLSWPLSPFFRVAGRYR